MRVDRGVQIVLQDHRGVIGLMPLDELLARVPEAVAVAAAAVVGRAQAADQIEGIVATASDPRAPADLRGGNACGVFLLSLAMRVVAGARAGQTEPAPREDSIETTCEVVG